MNPDYRTELARRTNAVFRNHPDLYDHLWLIGALGDADAARWFVGDNPSLGQVDRVREPQGGPTTEEAQWGSGATVCSETYS
jgi:hypothetical protein